MTTARALLAAAAAAAAVAPAACSDVAGDPFDAGIDAPAFDAGPDAFEICPGELLFTGDWVDWDSSLTQFKGIAEATATEVGDPSNTDVSSPNGRVELCIARGADTAVLFEHGDYLTMRFGVSAAAAEAGAFTSRGLTPARADALFSGELSLERDAAAAQVIVDVRRFPGGDPVIGATVSIGEASQGQFTPDADGDMVAGAVTTDDGFVLFANVDPGAGATTVTVTPPGGTTCTGRASIPLEAGEVAFTMYACE